MLFLADKKELFQFMLYNAALVLEGGAFRGQYTAGIVDTFLAHHIEFRSVIGVSAGSLCGVNFVSKQYGRAANININHRHDRQYISMARVFKKQIINLDYLFEDHGYITIIQISEPPTH